MDKLDTAELHDFCLAWQMESDTIPTMKGWFYSFDVTPEHFKEECKRLGWWVESMDKILSW